MQAKENRQWGILLAVGAQLIWGGFPIYLDWLKMVPSQDIVAHRTIWSFGLLLGLMAIRQMIPIPMLPSSAEARSTLRDRSKLLWCVSAAVLIAINWLMFVWAANHDHKVDASLGYYICPQVLVVLGVVLLGERLSVPQWIAVGLVSLGVLICGQSGTGQIWISLIIAFSFGLYAFCKKRIKLTALGSLTIETGLLSIPAIIFVGFILATRGSFFSTSWLQNGLLLGTGIATVAPLALYAAALKHISLALMGFLQFIGPTMQLLIGYFLFDEPIDGTRLLGFGIVWSGVILFLLFLPRSNNAKDPIADKSKNE